MDLNMPLGLIDPVDDVVGAPTRRVGPVERLVEGFPARYGLTAIDPSMVSMAAIATSSGRFS
jgi:hypothetical protein